MEPRGSLFSSGITWTRYRTFQILGQTLRLLVVDPWSSPDPENNLWVLGIEAISATWTDVEFPEARDKPNPADYNDSPPLMIDITACNVVNALNFKSTTLPAAGQPVFPSGSQTEVFKFSHPGDSYLPARLWLPRIFRVHVGWCNRLPGQCGLWFAVEFDSEDDNGTNPLPEPLPHPPQDSLWCMIPGMGGLGRINDVQCRRVHVDEWDWKGDRSRRSHRWGHCRAFSAGGLVVHLRLVHWQWLSPNRPSRPQLEVEAWPVPYDVVNQMQLPWESTVPPSEWSGFRTPAQSRDEDRSSPLITSRAVRHIRNWRLFG